MIGLSRNAHLAGMSLTLALCLAACGGNDSLSENTSSVVVTWSECAREGGTCTFSGTREVRYGTTEKYTSTQATNGVVCNNITFGDPAVGLLKTCWVASTTGAVSASGGGSADTGGGNSTGTVDTGSSSTVSFSPGNGNAGPRVTSFASSGPITARAGQVIEGVRISNTSGPCIVIPSGAANVIVRDSDIGPCAGDASIVVQGSGATLENNFVHEGRRGILVTRTSNASVLNNKVHGPFAGNSCGTSNPSHCSSAIQLDNVNNATVQGNEVRGNNYGSDALSIYESSSVRLVGNDIDVNIAWQHAAGFTMGDSASGNPGRDNYVAGNVVRQTGGVPAGVFGSNGNTILEKNCLTGGIQAFNYSGTFVGVTVRNNVINMGASYVPDTSAVSGWSSNVNSTNCALVPN
jgi:hypothetical protein